MEKERNGIQTITVKLEFAGGLPSLFLVIPSKEDKTPLWSDVIYTDKDG